MVFCSNCGSNCGQGKFCPNCGTPVTPSVGADAPPTITRPKHCGACNLEVEGAGYEWQGQHFHEGCFRCSTCGGSLNGVSFSMVNSKPKCTNCNKPNNTSKVQCRGCSKDIAGAFVSAMDAKWHPTCFCCAKCRKSFTAGYIEKAGKPYCQACVPASQTITTGVRQQGFTIDPRSGKKKYTNLK
eukprot:TRINITY_DN5067_c0_g1_i1.p1 TRINITY_DN5067_c0_g1~~TRINITY_DN5067_c0_g1_i1.p1  ORF type:complete len:184 (+),score=20.54 TRINITY_DN5067_c0_g1_i1:100-651(+)